MAIRIPIIYEEDTSGLIKAAFSGIGEEIAKAAQAAAFSAMIAGNTETNERLKKVEKTLRDISKKPNYVPITEDGYMQITETETYKSLAVFEKPKTPQKAK